MTDDARTDEMGDEDRLPWLEAVEEDEDRDGPSMVKVIGLLVVGLVSIGIILGGLFYFGNRNRVDGNGDVIAAPEGDYKVKPEQPGGMNVAGEGDTAFAASEGAEPKGQLNTNAVPETPVTQARPGPRPPQPATSAPGATIQLGAFSSQAGANQAWSGLSGRFRYLAPLSHSVVPVASGGRTLYRLRASGPDAAGICRRLQVAGEACSVVT